MSVAPIATITLNPAVDQTVEVPNFRLDSVNRGQTMHFHAGGKGINVASYLADYGLPTVVTGFLGEDNPSLFEALFASKGIADHFVRVPGRTRTGVKIVDEVVQQTTDINMPGAPASPEAIARLLEVVDELAQQCEWFVLAGSLPPGAPADLYATLTRRLRAQGKRVALDTSGPALHAGLEAGPTLAKPNIHELEQVTGRALSDSASVEQAARALMGQHGIDLLAISMGSEGALLVDAAQTLLAVPPRVTVASTVGAGDAMVAGLIAAAVEGLALPDAARLATAFAVNTITRVGPNLSPPDTLRQLAAQISVTSLS